jgi:hypothetical protein
MNIQTTPTKPADLDSTRLHSQAEVNAWKDAMADYHQALRNIEQAKQVKAEAVTAHANRTLTESEYFDLAVKRKKESDAKQAAHAAIQKAKELAAIDFAMSSPPVADIMETNEYRFLASVVNFANRGYTLGDNGIHHFGMGLYHCQLDAPVVAKKAGK